MVGRNTKKKPQTIHKVRPRPGKSSDAESGRVEVQYHTGTGSLRGSMTDRRRDAFEAPVRPGREEAELSEAIDEALRQIEETRRQTRAHDEEMARLQEETRRLIDEMLRDLNLKAA